MTTKYFKNFESLAYRFGNEEDTALFNNLTQYVDLIDQIKDNVAFLNKYTILSGDRADSLSFKLYGTTDYYWTFYLMNDDLRLSGWPVDTGDLLSTVVSKYPNRFITFNNRTTIGGANEDIAVTFPVGQSVTGASSTTVGTIVKRNLDLGQLFIKITSGTKFSVGEQLQFTDTNSNVISLVIASEGEQYNAVHHYKNTNDKQVDIDPYPEPDSDGTRTVNTSGLIPVTYRDRLETRNDELKSIIVIRPDSIDKVVSDFNKALKS